MSFQYHRTKLSLRAKRSNLEPLHRDCFVAALLAMTRELFPRPLVGHAAVLDRHPGDQALLGRHRVAVAVAQLEIAVAALEERDVGVGAGAQGADRPLVAHDPG